MCANRLVVLIAALALFACPGSSPTVNALCTKNAAVDPSSKVGACPVTEPSSLLGDKTACETALKPCSEADQQALTAHLDCLSSLPVCTDDTLYPWAVARIGCNQPVQALSEACAATVFGGMLPTDDAGVDAGPYDAGRQPADGGSAVELFAAADETGISFAWTVSQQGPVARWEFNVFDPADGGRLPEFDVTPGNARLHELALDAGVSRWFFVAGLSAQGLQVVGDAPDAGSAMEDAGVQCTRPTDCAPEFVCNLGRCETQACQPAGMMTCPPGYSCQLNMTCVRMFSDAGTFDAGQPMVVDAGVFEPLPLLSKLIAASTGPATYAAPIPVGGYPSKRPDLLAFDTAHQFVAVEQDGLPVGHATKRRGLDLPDDSKTASPIDTVGQRIRLAWVPETDVVFACYNVGRGVRIRRSLDRGRSWGTLATTLEPQASSDGGLESSIRDCDLAAWKNGQVMMVTIEDDSVVVRTVNDALTVGQPEKIFTGGAPDGGSEVIFSPQRPAIATLPSDDIVHVAYTGSRQLGGLTDTEIFGQYRDGTTSGVFLSPKFIAPTPNLIDYGNGLPQDHVSLAVDPKTKKGLAVFGTLVAQAGAAQSPSSVAIAHFDLTNKRWITGEPLLATYRNPTSSRYYLFPDREPAVVMDIMSPSLVVSRLGAISLVFAAAPRDGSGNLSYRMYSVPFSFDAQVPQGTAKGWFVPPAVRLSDTRVLDPRSGANVVPQPVSASGTDRQRSSYVTFIEGVGAFGEVENRAVMLTRP